MSSTIHFISIDQLATEVSSIPKEKKYFLHNIFYKLYQFKSDRVKYSLHEVKGLTRIRSFSVSEAGFNPHNVTDELITALKEDQLFSFGEKELIRLNPARYHAFITQVVDQVIKDMPPLFAIHKRVFYSSNCLQSNLEMKRNFHFDACEGREMMEVEIDICASKTGLELSLEVKCIDHSCQENKINNSCCLNEDFLLWVGCPWLMTGCLPCCLYSGHIGAKSVKCTVGSIKIMEKSSSTPVFTPSEEKEEEKTIHQSMIINPTSVVPFSSSSFSSSQPPLPANDSRGHELTTLVTTTTTRTTLSSSSATSLENTAQEGERTQETVVMSPMTMNIN
jgi:hypothetical protein